MLECRPVPRYYQHLMPKTSPSAATKADVRMLQQDIRKLEQRVDARIERMERRIGDKMEKLDQRVDTRMQQMEQRIMSRFDVLMENLVHDFRGAHKDKIEIHQDKLKNHDARIDRLERQAGLVAS